jgi:hypothetical protein
MQPKHISTPLNASRTTAMKYKIHLHQPINFKNKSFAGKVVEIVYWNNCEVIHICYVTAGTTVAVNY